MDAIMQLQAAAQYQSWSTDGLSTDGLWSLAPQNFRQPSTSKSHRSVLEPMRALTQNGCSIRAWMRSGGLCSRLSLQRIRTAAIEHETVSAQNKKHIHASGLQMMLRFNACTGEKSAVNAFRHLADDLVIGLTGRFALKRQPNNPTWVQCPQPGFVAGT
jgi:hypothetical protein